MKLRTWTLMRFNANSDGTGAPCGQIGGSLEWLVDSILRPHRCDELRLLTHEAGNSRQVQKNRNKRSHNTENQMVQVFINSRSGRVKGSHKSPYVTLSYLLSGGYLEKSKSKARRHSAGQCINGALAGDKASNLPARVQ